MPKKCTVVIMYCLCPLELQVGKFALFLSLTGTDSNISNLVFPDYLDKP